MYSIPQKTEVYWLRSLLFLYLHMQIVQKPAPFTNVVFFFRKKLNTLPALAVLYIYNPYNNNEHDNSKRHTHDCEVKLGNGA